MMLSIVRWMGMASIVASSSAVFADPSPPACPEKYQDLSEAQRAGEHTCKCTSASGGVWGTNTYTGDSAICVAAMHLGLIDTQGHGGNVTVKASPGCETYKSTTANGITTRQYGKFATSFYFPAKSDGACVDVDLPKPAMKNAALEAAVAAAYKRDYEYKVLGVILEGWLDEFETDALGRTTGRDMAATVITKLPDGKCELHYELWVQNGNGRSFSGPLHARGAGSKETSPISCAKAEAAAKPAPAKKKK